MKKILILDANSLLNRAFYGIRPLTTSDGLNTNAVFGFINIVKKHLDAQKPDFAVAAFDVHAPTFRHKLTESYKATRHPMPDELREQLPFIRLAASALGLHIVEKEGFEADDILGTLSKTAEDLGYEAVLVTGDRDSFQLVSDKTTLVLAANLKDDIITPQVIRERFSLEPKQLIDVKALAGDTSDNISGVKGIGEKTAVKLICENHDLDTLYKNIDSLSVGPSAKEKLRAGKEDAFFSRILAEIKRDVPELSDFESLIYSGIKKEELKSLLLRLEFSKMLRTFGLDEVVVEEKPAAEAVSVPDDQLSIFDVGEVNLSEIPEVDASLVSDFEPVLFYSDSGFFILKDSAAARLSGDIFGYLKKARPVLCDFKAYLHKIHSEFGDISGFEAKFDISLASYVINSANTAPTLDRLALIYLKKSISPSFDRDPALSLSLISQIYPIEHDELKKIGADRLFYEIELPLSYTLCQMEIAGFYVSKDGLIAYGEFLNSEMSKKEKEIFEIAGEKFNVNSPKQLSYILFDKLMLPTDKRIVKKTKTGYSTAEETLRKLAPYSPIIDLILDYRTYSKLYGTYVQGLLSQIAEDGRIHTVFNQTLTLTGRLSSAEPNLQNIPVKTELGREFRKFFVAEKEGFVLIDADYSQIELRILAAVSKDENLIALFKNGADIHRATAAKIFHIPEEMVTPEMRKSAKAVNFGIVYGIGAFSLAQDIGVSNYAAKEYIDSYFALFPRVREYLDGQKDFARKNGYVETLFNRRRYIPELSSGKKMLASFGERVAMNAPIQGTAADIIKIAMVNVSRRLESEKLQSRLILQVHDELIIEAPESEKAYVSSLLSEEMQNAVSLAVPLIAEAVSGKSWFDAK